MARFDRLLPLWLMQMGVGFMGFALSLCWTYRVDRVFDSDRVKFLIEFWAGLTAAFLLGAVLFSN